MKLPSPLSLPIFTNSNRSMAAPLWRRKGIAGDCGAVAGGAVVGALARFVLTESLAKPRRPAAIAAINIVGSFALGALACSLPALSDRQRLLFGTGLCGSFTTFSTFSVDALAMIEQGQAARAAGYVLASNAGGIGAAALAARLLSRR
jgi:CrcB protein